MVVWLQEWQANMHCWSCLWFSITSFIVAFNYTSNRFWHSFLFLNHFCLFFILFLSLFLKIFVFALIIFYYLFCSYLSLQQFGHFLNYLLAFNLFYFKSMTKSKDIFIKLIYMPPTIHNYIAIISGKQVFKCLLMRILFQLFLFNKIYYSVCRYLINIF